MLPVANNLAAGGAKDVVRHDAFAAAIAAGLRRQTSTGRSARLLERRLGHETRPPVPVEAAAAAADVHQERLVVAGAPAAGVWPPK